MLENVKCLMIMFEISFRCYTHSRAWTCLDYQYLETSRMMLGLT